MESVSLKLHIFEQRKKQMTPKIFEGKEWLISYLNQGKCLSLLQDWDIFDKPLAAVISWPKIES